MLTRDGGAVLEHWYEGQMNVPDGLDLQEVDELFGTMLPYLPETVDDLVAEGNACLAGGQSNQSRRENYLGAANECMIGELESSTQLYTTGQDGSFNAFPAYGARRAYRNLYDMDFGSERALSSVPLGNAPEMAVQHGYRNTHARDSASYQYGTCDVIHRFGQDLDFHEDFMGCTYGYGDECCLSIQHFGGDDWIAHESNHQDGTYQLRL